MIDYRFLKIINRLGALNKYDLVCESFNNQNVNELKMELCYTFDMCEINLSDSFC